MCKLGVGKNYIYRDEYNHLFKVIALAKERSYVEGKIVYQSLENYEVWILPLSDFSEIFTRVTEYGVLWENLNTVLVHDSGDYVYLGSFLGDYDTKKVRELLYQFENLKNCRVKVKVNEVVQNIDVTFENLILEGYTEVFIEPNSTMATIWIPSDNLIPTQIPSLESISRDRPTVSRLVAKK